MGLRLVNQHKGGFHPRQVPGKIEVYDKEWSSGQTLWFRTDRAAAVIRWGGDLEDLDPRVCSSHCKFALYLEYPSLYAFYEDLKLAQEDRFTIVVSQGPDVKFVGNIVHNGMRKEDSNHPTPKVILYAADGLEKFKTIDYALSNGTLYDGNVWVPIRTHLQRIFNLLDSRDFFGAAQGVLVTSDLYDSQMNATADNFDQINVSNQVFLKKTDNDTKPVNCYEALDIICRITQTRLIPIDGFFVFESINVRSEGGTFKRWWYTIDMSPNGSIDYDSTNVEITNLPVSPARGPTLRIREGDELQYPPIRTVRVRYEHGTGQDFLHGKLWDFTGEPGALFTGLGVAPVPDDVTRFKFQGTIEILPKWDSGPADTNRYRIIFYFYIKIGTQYYERLLPTGEPEFLVGSYQKETWTSTGPPAIDPDGTGEFALAYPGPISQDRDDERRIPLHFEILSFPIPETLDGQDIDVGIRFSLYDQDSNLVPEAPLTIRIQLEDGQFLIVDQENSKVEKSVITAKVTNSVDNSSDYTITIPTSDGPNNSAKVRLRVNTGPGPDTDSWSSGRYTNKHHYELLALELAHRRAQPRVVLDGAIYTFASLLRNFTYCGNTLIWLNGEYSTGTTIADGMWLYKVSLPTQTIIAEIDNESQDTGGKPTIDLGGFPPPPPPHIQVLEGPLFEITPDIDIPDLSGFTDLQIWQRIKPMVNGVARRITQVPENDGWTWDNPNKKIIPDEQIRQADWVKIEYDRSLLYE